MALNIASLALVLGITFMHSIFGFFSGLINLCCTILAMCVAFGFYEPLNLMVTGVIDSMPPSYCEPACLVLLFVLTLTLLRTATDNLIRGNVNVPQAVNTAGAIVCGFFIGMIKTGVLMIAVLMLPIGGRVMGFARFERTEDQDPEHKEMTRFERRSLWMMPDEFTIGLFNMLSNGSMKGAGSTAFAAVYPNFIDSVFFTTNTVQAESATSPYREKKVGDGFKTGLELVQWWIHKGPIDVRYRKDVPTEKNRTPPYVAIPSFAPASDRTVMVFRVKLNRSSADRDKTVQAQVFRPTMLRLVGDDEGGAPRQYIPLVIGGADEKINGHNRLVELDNNFSLPSDENPQVDLYFEVDPGFKPRFVEFRRHARVAVTGEPAKAAPGGLSLVSAEEKARRATESQGRNFGQIIEAHMATSTQLPFDLSADAVKRASSSFTLKDNKLVSVRASGQVQRYAPTQNGGETIKDFQVPDGLRILQIRYKPKEVLTLFGQIFSFVGQLNQFEVVDDAGETYQLHGYFARTKRGSNEVFDFFFNGPKDDLREPSYRYMFDFKEVKPSELQSDDSMVMMYFLVKPGVKIVRIRLANSTSQGADLEISVPK